MDKIVAILFLLGSLAGATPNHRGLNPDSHEGSHSNVIGGREVTPHSHPSVVWMDAWGECMGHLISNEWVVTIAQCIAPADEATLVLGAHNIEEVEPEQVKLVSTDFIVHEFFDPDNFLYDIALVRLPENVTFTSAIQPADLPSYSIENGTTAILLGWGQTTEIEPYYSDVLREGKVTVSDSDVCDAFYGFVTPSTVCVMTGDGSAPFCDGDFGGGLYRENAIHAMASFMSSAGCDSDGGDVYTRVYDYVDWIKEHTGI